MCAFGFGAPSFAADTLAPGRLPNFNEQTGILDKRSKAQTSRSIFYEQIQPIVPGTPAALDAAGVPNSPYLETARRIAARHNIPETLFLRLINTESGWNVNALSPKGAMGLAQLMPGTAQLLRVDPSDPPQNLDGGARYLRMMYDRFGTWPLALAAYNAGPAAVAEYRGIPPFEETRNYVNAIWNQR